MNIGALIPHVVRTRVPPAKPAPVEPADQTAQIRASMEAVRDQLRRAGAAFGAAGTAIMAGLGYTQIHQIFPLPAGAPGWLLPLAIAGAALALGGAALLAGRFLAAQRRILVSTLPDHIDGHWKFKRFSGLREHERKLRDEITDAHARENDAASIRALDLRAVRLERAARRFSQDDPAKATLKDEAERLQKVRTLALQQAAMRVLEHRAQRAYSGRLTKMAVAAAIAGIITIFGVADYSKGQRDLIELRGKCADAQSKGAVDACDPVRSENAAEAIVLGRAAAAETAGKDRELAIAKAKEVLSSESADVFDKAIACSTILREKREFKKLASEEVKTAAVAACAGFS